MRLATAEQMKRMDHIAIAERGISSLALMERAAQGVARAAGRLVAGERLPEEGEILSLEALEREHAGGGPLSQVRNALGKRPQAAVFAGPGNNGGDGIAAAWLLTRAGYPAGGDLEALLAALSGRLGQGGPFPHEVGLFLGYPPEDVEGFCRHGGRNYKLSGPWKVYGRVEEARARFRAFHRCRDALYRRVEEGRTLAQLFPVA